MLGLERKEKFLTSRLPKKHWNAPLGSAALPGLPCHLEVKDEVPKTMGHLMTQARCLWGAPARSVVREGLPARRVPRGNSRAAVFGRGLPARARWTAPPPPQSQVGGGAPAVPGWELVLGVELSK